MGEIISSNIVRSGERYQRVDKQSAQTYKVPGLDNGGSREDWVQGQRWCIGMAI